MDKIREAFEPTDYDAGCFNDYGGGKVEWWFDYLRFEINRANEHWREQWQAALASTTMHPQQVQNDYDTVPIANKTPHYTIRMDGTAAQAELDAMANKPRVTEGEIADVLRANINGQLWGDVEEQLEEIARALLQQLDMRWK